jgi:hypothetical protein
MGKMRYDYNILVRKPKGKTTRKTFAEMGNNIRMDLREIG